MFQPSGKSAVLPASPLFRWVAALALAGVLLALARTPALAHTRVEVGPYVIILGWAEEPVIVGERNALLLIITEGDAPVEAAERDLELRVLYGGKSFLGILEPTGTPGHYIVEIFPTVRGQYEVHLSGSIGGTAVDEFLEPEEVLPGDIIQFPEAQPAVTELQARIVELETRLGSARTLAIAGLVVGGLGLALAGVSLFTRRK
jgi:hypothetical protein